MKSIYRNILILLLSLLLASCYVAPEDLTDRAELQVAIKRLATPTNLTIECDHSAHEIYLEWDAVSNADYYVVSYQRVSDYISGLDAKIDITVNNSYTLKGVFNSDSDNRYIFAVKAVNKTIGNGIESNFSSRVEGVILNDFTLSSVLRSGYASIYAYTGNISSAINTGSNIVTPIIRYYDEDNSEIENSENIPLSSAEEKVITAKMFVLNSEGSEVEIATQTITLVGDLDYTPKAIKSLEVGKDNSDYISITWVAADLNKGFTAEELSRRFDLERSTDLKNWDKLLDKRLDLESGYEEVEYSPELSTFTYLDSATEPNLTYYYRVTSYYYYAAKKAYISEQADDVIIEKGWLKDTLVKDFRITDFEYAINDDQSATYRSTLSWSTAHDLSDGNSFRVYRIDYDNISLVATDSDVSSSREVIYSGSDTTYVDEFVLSAQENKSRKQYIYYIYIVGESGEESGFTVGKTESGESVVATTSSIEQFDYISSIEVSDAFAESIRVEFKVEEENITSHGLSLDNVSLLIKRSEDKNSDLNSRLYTIEDIIDLKDESGSYFYEDSEDLAPGISYYYSLQVFYSDEDSDYYGQQPRTSAYMGKILSLPEEVNASINSSSEEISLSWSSVEKATGYAIMYRRLGSSDSFATKTIEDSSIATASLSRTEDGIGRDVDYELAVLAIDENGNYYKGLDELSTVEGRILGPIQVIDDATLYRDQIKLSWKAQENISRYKVAIYNDSTNKKISEYYVTDRAEDGNYQIVLSADDPIIQNQEASYVLSTTYSFIVNPTIDYDSVFEDDDLTRYERSWIMPPKNIVATKADYRDMIKVSWDAMSGVDGYYVYSRRKGEASWIQNNRYVSASSSDLSFTDYNPSDELFEYTVASVKNGIIGLQQIEFNGEDNIGYTLMKPSVAYGNDEGNEILSFTFSPVSGATSYLLTVPDWDYIEIPITAEVLANPTTSKEAGTVSIDSSNGYITYYLKRNNFTKGATLNAAICAKRDDLTTDVNYSYGNTITIYAKSLNAVEIVNALNYVISTPFTEADTSFSGDWWTQSGSTYSPNALVKIVCSKGVSQSDGTATFTRYSDNDTEVSGSVRVHANSDFGSDGLAGYLGTDPLDTIKSGTLTVILPYQLGTYTVTYSSFSVSLTSGTATVTGPGISGEVVNAVDTASIIIV